MNSPEGVAPAVLEDARALSQALVDASGHTVAAVILYGSHLLGATPDRHSAYDFVVLVDDYRRFYRAVKASGEMHRPAWLMSAVSRVLPPNVIAFTPESGEGGIAKCLIISKEHFARALGPRPRDHFVLGRMIQKVAVVWERDAGEATWVEDRLGEARGGVLEWMAPYVEGVFDSAELGRQLLAVCYRGEFRPEAKDRSRQIFEGQRAHFREHLVPGLLHAEARGRVVREGADDPSASADARYRLAAPAPLGARLRWRWHFIRSKARVTARWPKHILTFDNWLPYILRKVERRTGMKVEVSPWERRLPLLLLWPKVIKVLRARPAKELPSKEQPS